MPDFIDYTPGLVAAAVLATILVGLSKGGLPTVGMLSVPILALAMPPVAAAALLLPIYVVSDVVGVYLYRHAFSRRNIAILFPAALAGIAAGWAGASVIPERGMTFLVGVIGLGFCINTFANRNRASPPAPADVPRGLVWGWLTGLTSFVSHSGAPPFQIYVLPQQLPKLVFAGTSTILFALVNAAKLLPYWALGQFTPGNLGFAALLAPVAVASAFGGAALVRILPERLFYRLVYAVLFAVSIKLIFDALVP